MDKVVIKTLNVTSISKLMYRVVPGMETEWELVDGYTSRMLSTMVDAYIEKYTIEASPNFEFLFHFLTVLKSVLVRQTPLDFDKIVDKITVINRYKKDTSWYIDIEYKMS